MFNLEIITRILNFVWKDYRNIKERVVNLTLMERTIRKKKKKRTKSTCLIKFYGSYLS